MFIPHSFNIQRSKKYPDQTCEKGHHRLLWEHLYGP